MLSGLNGTGNNILDQRPFLPMQKRGVTFIAASVGITSLSTLMHALTSREIITVPLMFKTTLLNLKIPQIIIRGVKVGGSLSLTGASLISAGSFVVAALLALRGTFLFFKNTKDLQNKKLNVIDKKKVLTLPAKNDSVQKKRKETFNDKNPVVSSALLLDSKKKISKRNKSLPATSPAPSSHASVGGLSPNITSTTQNSLPDNWDETDTIVNAPKQVNISTILSDEAFISRIIECHDITFAGRYRSNAQTAADMISNIEKEIEEHVKTVNAKKLTPTVAKKIKEKEAEAETQLKIIEEMLENASALTKIENDAIQKGSSTPLKSLQKSLEIALEYEKQIREILKKAKISISKVRSDVQTALSTVSFKIETSLPQSKTNGAGINAQIDQTQSSPKTSKNHSDNSSKDPVVKQIERSISSLRERSSRPHIAKSYSYNERTKKTEIVKEILIAVEGVSDKEWDE